MGILFIDQEVFCWVLIQVYHHSDALRMVHFVWIS